MRRLLLMLGLAFALLAPVLLPAQSVTVAPCRWTQEAIRTPFTDLVPLCVGTGSLRAVGRLVRRWGPWALSVTALGVALDRDRGEPAMPPSSTPRHPHPHDDP